MARTGPQRAQLECMDVAIGRVLKAIADRGIDRETLVMFANDNGGPHRMTTNGPYRGFKSHYHEGGIRVPAAVRWPGVIPAGAATNEMLHAVDCCRRSAAWGSRRGEEPAAGWARRVGGHRLRGPFAAG